MCAHRKAVLGRARLGTLSLLSPSIYALLAGFIGLPASQLNWFAGVSVVGLALWGRRYRDVIWGCGA